MRKLNLFILYLLFLLLLELVYKITFYGNVFDYSLLTTFVFILPISVLLGMVSNIFKKEKYNHILTSIILIAITIIYIAQMVYMSTYGALFSLFSASSGNQVFQFYEHIIETLKDRTIPIIIFIFITLLSIIFSNKIFSYQKVKLKNQLLFLIFLILTTIISRAYLLIGYSENLSNYELFYNTASSNKTAREFGVINGMYIDARKNMVGVKDTFIFDETIENEAPCEDQEEVIPIDYNVSDIDFDKLINEETDETVINLHKFFKSQTPSKQNDYTGIFEGKNLIVILAESFDSIAIDEEVTPTLYKIANEGLYFSNFYTPLYPVSTSDGEYMSQLSLLPKEGIWTLPTSSELYYPYALGNTFSDLGYITNSYHNHTGTYYSRNLSHPNLGYTYKACGLGLDINCDLWPESDLEMIEATTNEFLDSDSPFLTYYITVSGHLQYSQWNAMAIKNQDAVEELEYSDKINNFMAQHVELDKALETLLADLEESGELDNTVIALYPDHYPYGLSAEELNEKSTFERDDKFDLHKNCLMIYNSTIEAQEIDKLSSNLDILPTLYNLFGIEYDSRLLIGSDVLSDDEPIVIFADQSFITEDGTYNSITEEYQGNYISDEELTGIKNDVSNKFDVSKVIYDLDYYRYIFKN